MAQPVVLPRGLSRQVLVLFISLASVVGMVLLSPSQRASAEPSLSEAERQVDDLGRKMNQKNEEINTIQEELKTSQKRRSDLDSQFSTLEAEYQQARQKVSRIGATAYESGQFGVSKVLLSSENTDSLLAQLSYLEYINSNQQSAIKSLKSSHDDLEETREKIDEEISKQEQRQKELNDQKTQLEKDLQKWQQLKQQLAPKAPVSDDYEYVSGGGSGKGAQAVDYADAQRGKSYRFGAAGPNEFDCSGLTSAAWRSVGVTIPHSAAQQYSNFPKVARSNLQLGDLVSFYEDHHHVGIYIGDGRVIHAPQQGDVVKIAPITAMPYSGATRPA